MGLLLAMRSYSIKKINHKVYDDVTEVPDNLVIHPDWKVAEIGKLVFVSVNHQGRPVKHGVVL